MYDRATKLRAMSHIYIYKAIEIELLFFQTDITHTRANNKRERETDRQTETETERERGRQRQSYKARHGTFMIGYTKKYQTQENSSI